MTLRILATGGTFDKRYDPLQGELGFGASHLPNIIARTRMTTGVELELLALKDSLDMQDADRSGVLAACQKSGERSPRAQSKQ